MKSISILITSFLVFFNSCLYGQDDVKAIFAAKDFTVKTIPRNADIYAINSNGGDVKLGNDTADLHLDKDETYTIESKEEGYKSVRKVYARQKGGIEEDIIELPTRVMKINVNPLDAKIFADNVSVNNSGHEIVIPKGKSVTVDVKYPGYVTQTKVFYNKPGEEVPDLSYLFKLEDRVVTVKATPETASIMADGKKIGLGTADVVVKRNSCVNVSVEHEGYVSKSVTYCNKDNESEPPLDEEIQLKDRLAQFNITPESATITVDGKEMGKGSYAVKIPEGKCVEVLIQNPGNSPILESLCNKPDGTPPEASYILKMPDDEAYTQSEESSVANQSFSIDVNPSLAPLDAWKKLVSIIEGYFDEIESQDAVTTYLKTNWVASIPFNINSPFPRIIRTRVVVTNGGTDPIKYNIKIFSEISRTGNDCKPEGMKYPPVNRDDCFDPFPRIYRKYKDLIGEAQARMK